MELNIIKGDIVVCALSGDYGKPRPAVIVQSDLFNPTHESITICPITSFLIDASFIRLTIEPEKKNGLQAASQIMIDKIISIKRDKIRQKIGMLSQQQREDLNKALKLWLGLNN